MPVDVQFPSGIEPSACLTNLADPQSFRNHS